MTRNDCFRTLGLKPGASSAEIKAAYRRLAQLSHPDVSSEPGAEELFKRISEAYKTLTAKSTKPAPAESRHVSPPEESFAEAIALGHEIEKLIREVATKAQRVHACLSDTVTMLRRANAPFSYDHILRTIENNAFIPAAVIGRVASYVGPQYVGTANNRGPLDKVLGRLMPGLQACLTEMSASDSAFRGESGDAA